MVLTFVERRGSGSGKRSWSIRLPPCLSTRGIVRERSSSREQHQRKVEGHRCPPDRFARPPYSRTGGTPVRPGGFLFHRARRILFCQDKRKWGRIPPARLASACPRRGPASNLPQLPFKKPPKQAECPLDRDTAAWYSVLEFEKGIEKDAVRERHQRGAAVGCKRLLPLPEYSHRLGAAHRYVGWDGTSRYRGHERRSFGSASRVEPWNTIFVSHP